MYGKFVHGQLHVCLQDEMLPPEHMARMHKMLLAQKGQVTWAPMHAGHMDAYETAAQVSHAHRLPKLLSVQLCTQLRI